MKTLLQHLVAFVAAVVGGVGCAVGITEWLLPLERPSVAPRIAVVIFYTAPVAAVGYLAAVGFLAARRRRARWPVPGSVALHALLVTWALVAALAVLFCLVDRWKHPGH